MNFADPWPSWVSKGKVSKNPEYCPLLVSAQCLLIFARILLYKNADKPVVTTFCTPYYLIGMLLGVS